MKELKNKLRKAKKKPIVYVHVEYRDVICNVKDIYKRRSDAELAAARARKKSPGTQHVLVKKVQGLF